MPIHKKGSKMLCNNYRGISLLSIPCEVYTRILDARVRSRTESKVMEVQGGGGGVQTGKKLRRPNIYGPTTK